MANGIGQGHLTVDSYDDDLTSYLYVYTRADGRVVSRRFPMAPPSTPSHQESQPEEADGTGVEEQGEHKKEEQTKVNKSVF